MNRGLTSRISSSTNFSSDPSLQPDREFLRILARNFGGLKDPDPHFEHSIASGSGVCTHTAHLLEGSPSGFTRLTPCDWLHRHCGGIREVLFV